MSREEFDQRSTGNRRLWFRGLETIPLSLVESGEVISQTTETEIGVGDIVIGLAVYGHSLQCFSWLELDLL